METSDASEQTSSNVIGGVYCSTLATKRLKSFGRLRVPVTILNCGFIVTPSSAVESRTADFQLAAILDSTAMLRASQTIPQPPAESQPECFPARRRNSSALATLVDC